MANEIIYCLPHNTNRFVLFTDLKEYALSLKNDMKEHSK